MTYLVVKYYEFEGEGTYLYDTLQEVADGFDEFVTDIYEIKREIDFKDLPPANKNNN